MQIVEYENKIKDLQLQIDLVESENNILLNRLYYLQKYLLFYGHRFPNKKQEISSYTCVDDILSIIKGDYKEVQND